MKKRIFLSLFLACASFMYASAKSVVFTLNDGTLVYYLLGGTTNPMLRFVEGGVTVDADSYTFSQIKNFYISTTDDPNAIENVIDNSSSFNGKALLLDASKVKSVKVYDVTGAVVEANVSNVDGLLSVDLDNLPKGVYIVNTGSSSIKLMKK